MKSKTAKFVHDISNKVTIIIGQLNISETEIEEIEDPDLKKSLLKINTSTYSLKSLIEDFRDYLDLEKKE